MALPPPERRCTADARRGGQCPGWRLKSGPPFCAFHDPARAAQNKGGRTTGRKVREEGRAPTTIQVQRARVRLAALEEIPAAIELIANQVIARELTDKEGSTLARLASAAVQAHATIDELAERAHKRRTGLSDEQLAAALERLREPQREALS
jgi:hypothetical protein